MDDSISAADANRNFSHLLRSVREDHASYVVTSHGKPVARIVPYDGDEDRNAAREVAKKIMIERWSRQPSIKIEPWTRDELYERD